MPVQAPFKVQGKRPEPVRVNITDWKGGFNSFLDPVRKPKNALEESLNMILDQDGVPRKRPGTQNFGDPLLGQIDGDGTFSLYDTDKKCLIERNIAVVDGIVHTAQDAKNWQPATGVELTVGSPANFLPIDNKVFIANSVDSLAMYSHDTNTVECITPINNPNAPTLKRSSDLSSGNVTLRYQITAINAVGETAGSTIVTIAVNKQRDTWKNVAGTNGKSENVELTWTNVVGAKRYNIYCSDEADATYYIDSIGDSGGTNTSYTDEARSAGNKTLFCPPDNGTGGPRLSELSYSDNRVFGCGDPDFPYRVYWGGLSENITAFNWFYGGGWVDIGRGGDLIPVKVKSYRDGKGEPINTVFMTDVAGLGEQYQITLSTMTTGETAAIVPMLARVIGSYGTPAASSVVEAQNNLFYINKYAVSTTGAKPDMLNVLSTDEVSLSIRPNIQAINSRYISQVQAVFFHGKIYFAVAYGATFNNEIWVLDLELKTWMRPWKLPVGKWLIYTGENGIEHLLYRPSKIATDQSYLIEIDEAFSSDNGVPFDVKLKTPILQFDASHFQFQRVSRVYFELLRAVGNVSITISGTMKNRGYQRLKSFLINNQTSYAGFDNELYDHSLYDQAPTIPIAYKPIYVKKVLKVRKTLNNIQVEITADSKSDFILSVISILGTPKRVGDPSSWRK